VIALDSAEGGFKERKDSAVSFHNMAQPGQLNGRPEVGHINLPAPQAFPNMNGPNNPTPGGRGNAQPGLYRLNTQDMTPDVHPAVRTPASAYANPQSAGPSPAVVQTPAGQSSNSNIGLSGFVCNVHRTTGREPKPLVGATTTILGDKLYVFGGRRISRTKPQLTSDLYELDLVTRHWSKVECKGEVPPPRYFHSICPLGDTKLVCYGGMSPSSNVVIKSPDGPQDPNGEMGVMSDIHILDVITRTWIKVAAKNAPQGRYAHCATILPSSAVFSSKSATMSAIQHNAPSGDAPNQGKLGVSLDGSGGAEMIVVGGQDSTNHYIQQISVFNLRSLTWTSTNHLDRSCGAYRSVTAPLSASLASQIGMGPSPVQENDNERSPPDGGSAMLIYSNYNFLDVKLELQIHLADGTLVEKHMRGGESPPGLRFPNGGVLDKHFVVSGTFLTSAKQEYALWALDLRTLLWSRIDIGSSTFSQGSWNRGVLWRRRNAFVILGNRKRSLVEDYNHRRVNFTNMCVVELEAFGLYDNPRRMNPTSGFVSASSPSNSSYASSDPSNSSSRQQSTISDTSAPMANGNSPIPETDRFTAGRELSRTAEDLGRMLLQSSELADMEFLAINGERIPVNSRLVSRRWGPYFNIMLSEAVSGAEGGDTATLRPSVPSVHGSTISGSTAQGTDSRASNADTLNTIGNLGSVNPASRPRSFYLPHTPPTIHALLHFLYVSNLPPPSSPLCTPQILCSLLQIARPYKVDGLLEAVVERLHIVLDNRNTAAIFNAAAMAAGGGDGIKFVEDSARQGGRRVDDGVARPESPIMGGGRPQDGDGKKAEDDKNGDTRHNDSAQSDAETSEDDAPGDPETPGGGPGLGRPSTSLEPWAGKLSSVVGLQKRGLRGLMEGRRMREMAPPGGPIGGLPPGIRPEGGTPGGPVPGAAGLERGIQGLGIDRVSGER
jgi:hypothetical protein